MTCLLTQLFSRKKEKIFTVNKYQDHDLKVLQNSTNWSIKFLAYSYVKKKKNLDTTLFDINISFYNRIAK